MTENQELNFEMGDDVVGGEDKISSFSLIPSSLWKARITAAYMGKSKNGATTVSIEAEDANGTKHRETFYITDSNGVPYSIVKEKKVMRAGMRKIANLCQVLGFKTFQEVYAARAKRAISVYDFESRKEITKEVEMLTKITGKIVTCAIVHRIENKQKQVGKEWKPINEKREFNTILAFLNKENNRTAAEMSANQDAKYAVEFLAKYEGKVDDLFKQVEEDYSSTDTDGFDPLTADNETEDFI